MKIITSSNATTRKNDVSVVLHRVAVPKTNTSSGHRCLTWLYMIVDWKNFFVKSKPGSNSVFNTELQNSPDVCKRLYNQISKIATVESMFHYYLN